MQPSEVAKLDALRQLAINDSQHPGIRVIANQLWEAALGRPMTFLHLVHTLAKFGIHFKSDTVRTGHEDIAGLTRPPTNNDALDAYQRGVDDCDAKSRFFVALALAKGFDATVMPFSKPGSDMLDHVYPAVYIGGRWLSAETTVSRAVLGDKLFDIHKEKTGQWSRP